MRVAALILAAGRGTRAGGPLPKQWQPLAGRRLADWTLEAFAAHPRIAQVLVALAPGEAHHLPAGTDWCTGGATRADSARAGLEALAKEGPWDAVLIHDMARPCTPPAVIDAVLDALEDAPAAAPALEVTDALWRGQDGRVAETVPREGLYRAQTPQGFHFEAILAAHRAHAAQAGSGGAFDDVQIARAAGLDVTIVPGHEDNLKITRAEDFPRAEAILRGRMDIRLGNGFDVHRFAPGTEVTLCGVTLPHSARLEGHSDADVGMHAVTDAIYGALAEGDIGRHFPPSDPQWKGAASEIFLAHAGDLARSRGFAIGNVDCTLICEAPKIGPHAAAMQARLAEVLKIAPGRVSVKATTSERLGFTGREEGIAALATATLVQA